MAKLAIEERVTRIEEALRALELETKPHWPGCGCSLRAFAGKPPEPPLPPLCPACGRWTWRVGGYCTRHCESKGPAKTCSHGIYEWACTQSHQPPYAECTTCKSVTCSGSGCWHGLSTHLPGEGCTVKGCGCERP